MMVKSWFHGRSRSSLVIVDSADTSNDADDTSYINLEYFLPMHHLLTSSSRGGAHELPRMTALETVEVAGREPAEAAEVFRTSEKLGLRGSDVKEKVLLIVEELEHLALAVTLAESYIVATPRLSFDLGSYLP